MADWDRRGMYAHVFFNLTKDDLSIAVYDIGKVPGFSGNLEKDVKDVLGVEKAKNLFKGIFGKDMSPEELQLGKIFSYENNSKKIEMIDKLGKMLIKNETAQVACNLDDPMTWYSIKFNEFAPAQKLVASNLSEEDKKTLGEHVRDLELEPLELAIHAGDPEQVEDVLKKIYLAL